MSIVEVRKLLRRGLAGVMTACLIVPASLTTISAKAAGTGLEDAKELSLSFEKNVNDSTGKNNVTMHGSAMYTVGKKGQALLLNENGSKNYLSLGKNVVLQPNKMTIAFWMKADKELSGEHMIMWNTADGNHLGDGFYLTTSDDLALKLSVGNDYGGVTAAGDRSQFFPTGEWVHVVVTYDSATKTGAIYRNGMACELSQSSSNVMTFNANDEKYIGFNGPTYGGSYAQIALDEFELYSDVASADQAKAIYTASADELSADEIIAADKNTLNPFKSSATVTTDVVLPVSGANGSNITWTSSNEAVVSKNGKVTRGDKDQQVTLTATISYKGKSDTKTFKVTVPAQAEKQLWVSYDMTIQDGKLKDKCGRYDAVLSNMSAKNIVTDNRGKKALRFAGDKSQYVKLPAGILADGAKEFTVSMRFNTSQKAYAWVFNLGTKDTNNYVFLNPTRAGGETAFTIKEGGQGEKSVNGMYITSGADTVATMVFSADNSAKLYINGELKGSVKHGYEIANILANGVTDPADAIGYLGRSLYEYDPGYEGTISSFDVYNYSMTEKEVWEDYSDKYLNLTDEERVNGDFRALKLQSGNVETDTLDMPAQGLNGSKITWTSSNPDVISTDGKVTRPGKGEADGKVTLKATVSSGKVSKSKTYEMYVLAVPDTTDIHDFVLGESDVTDAYYDNASQKDIDFLKAFDADRLLSRYRDTAGLSNQGKSAYTGWEGTLIAGHTLGHYLTACAQAYVTADKAEDRAWMKQRTDYLIDELKKCQDAVGTGFIFGAAFAGSNTSKNIYDQFDRIENGTTTDTWVPWYNLHKLMAGLVDVYKYTGYEPAKTVASGLGDWIYNRVSTWDAATQRRVLNVEYGGMNDCLYELYKITGKEDHAKAAHMFDEDWLFEDVLTGDPSVISNKHANTTIPKFVGALNRYRTMQGKTIDGQKVNADKYLEYCEAFWDMVVNHHSYITGGNSQWEHFRGADALDVSRTQCNCETCNTYNMLKLSRELYKITGNRKYTDYYENTFINAIMSSIDPVTGGTTYFQPMATGYFKVFGDKDPDKNTFWCCTGSGMENFTKLGDSIYYYKDNKVIVNQYVSSVLTWNDKNIKLTQKASMPEKDTAELTVSLLNGASSANVELSLRIPDWIAGDPVIKVNGTKQDCVISGGYTVIKRQWKNNDKVEITLPMDVQAYGLKDDSTVYGFKYGPVVLSAELGTDERMSERSYCGWGVALPKNKRIGSESAEPKDGVREVLGSETIQIEDKTVSEYIGNINDYMIRKDKADGSLAFKLTGTDQELTFSTHFKQNTQRYGIYWYFSGNEDKEEGSEKILAKKEEGRDARIKGDVVKPGYPQYETDSLHNLQEQNSIGGADAELNGATSRYVNGEGYFAYRMAVEKGEKNYILCKLTKKDNGKTLKVSVDGQVICEEVLSETRDSDIYEKKIEIPAELIEKAVSTKITENGQENTYDTVNVKVEGAAGSQSARLVSELYIVTDYGHDASLKALEATPGTVKADAEGYVISVPKDTTVVELKAQLADQYGLLYVDDVLVDDTKAQEVTLTGDKTELMLKVYAEDHETVKEYKVTIQKTDSADKKLPYVDVAEDDWFYDGVYFNYFAEIMTGKDETHFAPLENLARAQFAVIVHRIQDKPKVEYQPAFPDVEDGIWYTDAILWAASAGVVTGYTDTHLFGPADDINREQMAVMMYRYADYLKYDISKKAPFDKFEDAGSVNEFAQEAMKWAVGTGIITGKYEGTKIDPQGKALRGECAIIIQRFMKTYKK